MGKKNITKSKKHENQATYNPPAESNTEPDALNFYNYASNEQMETELNSKILEITMRIKDHYPELTKYLEEMPVTVPTENNPEITLNHLRSYYESLYSLLDKYKLDYPRIKE
jgi:hypothetical protein